MSTIVRINDTIIHVSIGEGAVVLAALAANKAALAAEVTRATGVEATKASSSALSAEVTRATGVEGALATRTTNLETANQQRADEIVSLTETDAALAAADQIHETAISELQTANQQRADEIISLTETDAAFNETIGAAQTAISQLQTANGQRAAETGSLAATDAAIVTDIASLRRGTTKHPRFVSSRCRELVQYTGAATWTRSESRLRLYSPSAPVWGLRLVYANYYVGPATGEAENPNPITVAAAIEPAYTPAFTIPVTFGGRRQVVIDPGAYVVSDPVAGLSLANVTAWVRTAATFAMGEVYPQGYYAFQAGEGVVNSTASASQVYGTGAMSIPSGGTNTEAGYGPIGLIGYTAEGQVSLVYITNSNGDGTGDTPGIVDGFVARAMQSVNGAVMPGCRLTRGSDCFQANASPRGFRRRAMLDYGTHALYELAGNDIALGLSVATIKALAIESFAEARLRGLKIITVSIPPRTTSTDNWKTLANQSYISGFEPGGKRDQLNAWFAAGADGWSDIYVNINSAIAAPSDPNSWHTNGTNEFFVNIDPSHLGPYGHILAAGVLNTTLAALA